MNELPHLENRDPNNKSSRRKFIFSSLAVLLAGSRLEAPKFEPSKTINLEGVEIGKTYKRIEDYEIIVLHKSETLTPAKVFKGNFFGELLEGDPNTNEDNGFLLNEPNNPWTKAGGGVGPSFNCHSYAVGERLGLTPNDWLEGSPSPLTDDTNPLDIILKNSFQIVKNYSLESDMLNDFPNDTQILAGDIVTIIMTSRNAVRRTNVDYIHSGRVTKVRGKNWVSSKFGEGPILVTPLSAIIKEYQGQFNRMSVYRLKQ